MKQVEAGRYGAKVQASYQLGKKKAFLYGIFTGGIGAMAYCSLLTVLWYGGRLVIAGAWGVMWQWEAGSTDGLTDRCTHTIPNQRTNQQTGEMSPGTLTSFLLYTVYIATGLSVLSGLIAEWLTAIGASTRMFELLDREPAIPLHSKSQQPQPEALEGHVALEHVSFAYPSRSDVDVLKDFSLVVRPNTTVALVGQRCGVLRA